MYHVSTRNKEIQLATRNTVLRDKAIDKPSYSAYYQ